MTGWQNAIAKQRTRPVKLKTRLNCVQINLQHARLATDNLLKIIEKDGTDILCIQEPYSSVTKLWAFHDSTNFSRRGKEGNGRL